MNEKIPMSLLTQKSVEQKTLEVLQRIEVLLAAHIQGKTHTPADNAKRRDKR